MTAIQLMHLTKIYNSVPAVDSLDLSIEQGELFSLLGVNGAGKSTTIQMLSCLLRPTSGDALVFGDSILLNPSKVKARMNVSPQQTAIAPNLSVRENLEFISGVYGLSKTIAKKQADQMIERFGLSSVSKKRAKTLSGGWQRRLSIAMAFITEPEILFLDEPTLGLDILARRELWNIIRSLRGSVTIILTTHYLEEAEQLSDHIAILSKGTLAATGTPDELIEFSGTDNFEDAFIALCQSNETKQNT